MAWADAGQRSEALSVARTRCDFAVSNRPAVSTPATAASRCRCQSLTASGMIYDHVSVNYYGLAYNLAQLGHLKFVMETSLLKTLANKNQSSVMKEVKRL